jgi:hypothetical protein
MGWSLQIESDKPISEQDVQKALDKIPELHGDWGLSKQSWGWSSSVDVNLPNKDGISISGAWFSYDRAETFAQKFSAVLETLGYQLQVGKPIG